MQKGIDSFFTMNNWIQLTVEIVVGFISLLLIIKLLGKSQVGELHPLDFISAIVIGELVGAAVYEPQITVFHITYALFLWGGLAFSVKYLTIKHKGYRHYIDGNPSIVIRNGKIDKQMLYENKVDINQLQNMLRQKDVFSITEVEYAILEPDGSLSVLKKADYRQPTAADLNLAPKPVELPITFIIDGEIIWDNLKSLGFNEEWLQSQLQINGYNRVEDILFAEWQQSRGLFLMPYN